MKGQWPLVDEEGFQSAVVSPMKPVDLEKLLKPGSIAILRILNEGGSREIPDEDLKELEAMGYF